MGTAAYLVDKTKFIGEKFGHWLVIDVVDKSRVLVQCDCGSPPKPILLTIIRNGRSTRCSACKRMSKTTHGESKTPLYKVWRGMINRCHLPSTNSYKDYGAKGIEVCDQWRYDYSSFSRWSHINGYETGLEIDRIDNTKGYSPDNCRWVERIINANNKRNTTRVQIGDDVFTLYELEQKYNVDRRLIYERLRSGWSTEDAILPRNARGDGRKPPDMINVFGGLYTIRELSERTGLCPGTIHKRYSRRNNTMDIFSPVSCVCLSDAERKEKDKKIKEGEAYFYNQSISKVSGGSQGS